MATTISLILPRNVKVRHAHCMRVGFDPHDTSYGLPPGEGFRMKIPIYIHPITQRRPHHEILLTAAPTLLRDQSARQKNVGLHYQHQGQGQSSSEHQYRPGTILRTGLCIDVMSVAYSFNSLHSLLLNFRDRF